jgi:hypothetical protein
MRKHGLLPILVLLTCFAGHSQEVVFKISKSYFRSDPFRSEFSAFMKHLLNDPFIKDKVIEKRTDTSLFYFGGTYTSDVFNPFFFKPKRMEVALTEVPIKLDSTLTDTIFVYELFAYTDNNKQGNDEITKEYDKILKRYKNNFRKTEHTENPPGAKLQGGTYNFFDRYHAVSPFAISLYGPTENKEMCMIMTIRMDTYNNTAMLAAPFLSALNEVDEQ